MGGFSYFRATLHMCCSPWLLIDVEKPLMLPKFMAHHPHMVERWMALMSKVCVESDMVERGTTLYEMINRLSC